MPTVCPAGYFCTRGQTGGNTNNPCPPGTYQPRTGQKSVQDCLACPAGYWCSQAATVTTACPPGTFQPFTRAGTAGACLDCVPGYACPGSFLTSGTNTPCAAGYYCPPATVNPNDNPCPAGTWSDRRDLRSLEECEICPAGYFCPSPTGGPVNRPQNCQAGYFCPGALTQGEEEPMTIRSSGYTASSLSQIVSTALTDHPCPAGTYSDSVNLKDIQECTICPNGTYCGLASTSGDIQACQAGYYCPAGSAVANPFPCPAGTYSAATNLYAPEQCTNCPAGQYCEEAATAPVDCPAGTFSQVQNTKGAGPSTVPEDQLCMTCPAGYICGDATINPSICLAGTHSASGTDTCSQCPAGFYCPYDGTTTEQVNTLYKCPKGMFCPAGMDRFPDFEQDACPAGQYCPEAVPAPINCPAKTFNPNVGRGQSEDDCIPCPPGRYCLEGAVNSTGPCSPGHYCTGGSDTPTQFACPKGFYRLEDGGQNLDACAICPRGSYCGEAQVEPIPCIAGHYCVAGTHTPFPCPLGSFNNGTGLREENECIPCTLGNYCAGLGLVEPSGPCDPGYICLRRSYTSAPQDPVIGGLCPQGGYCPAGSFDKTVCPAGKFNNFTGGRSPDDCSPCPAGYFCSGADSTTPAGLCRAGFFCPGSCSSDSCECPLDVTCNQAVRGFYTAPGFATQRACPPGTFQPSFQSVDCEPCPAGRYCPVPAIDSVLDALECPAGFYCPSRSVEPLVCPPGSYSDTTQFSNVSACITCDAAKYCLGAGKDSPEGDCLKGYYCNSGSPVPNPNIAPGGSYGLCPAGSYCPGGNTITGCPVGTFNPRIGGEDVNACFPCQPGMYCNDTGLEHPVGPCDEGFYCLQGAQSPTPPNGATGGPCPQGHYCPVGTVSPIPCDDGFFADVTGLAVCKNCTAGDYCPRLGTINPSVCSPGRYCPTGTGELQPKCPEGTFNPANSQDELSDCQLCTGGDVCSASGLSAPNDQCDAGYWCGSGALNRQGATGIRGGSGGECPVGTYCPANADAPTNCTTGTFNPKVRGTSSNSCVPCRPGYYCASEMLSEPTGVCSEGHFCRLGASVPNPTDGVTGDECPVGHFCLANSTLPMPCEGGTFANVTGLSECYPCEAGFFCTAGATGGQEFQCPVGFFCEANQKNPFTNPCPKGTFSNTPGLSTVSQCQNCTAGSYCEEVSLTAVSGDCAPGYYCEAGSPVRNPATGSGYGGLCSVGHYCPEGSPFEIPCPPGEYCDSPGLAAPTGDCSAGHLCILRANVSDPSDGVTGRLCSAGHYCLEGALTESECSQGFYLPTTGGRSAADCIPCKEGSYCATQGLAAPTGLCAAGFFCPSQQTVSNANPCPQGYRCPAGSVEPQYCDPGYYQDTSQQSVCKSCEPGFYCEDSSFCNDAPGQRQTCPQGYWCPALTKLRNEFPCPLGTYGASPGLDEETDCTACPPGHYCDALGLTEPTGLCDAGYFCSGGSKTPTPPSGLCPAGKYCPRGTTSLQNCPVGTFSLSQGLTDDSECQPCPPGSYCANPGQVGLAAASPCDPGFVCLGGSTTRNPTDGIQGFQCGVGVYCPTGSNSTQRCPPGTVGSALQASSCPACPAGRYCPEEGLSVSEPCPTGAYCPTGSIIFELCPAGTYEDLGEQSSLSDCKPCPEHKYCGSRGLSAPSGDCTAGFYCAGSATVPSPTGPATYPPTTGPCPTGMYCPGDDDPVECAPGTFNPDIGGGSPDSCRPCIAGKFCAGDRLSEPTGDCAAGYYCPEGQTVAAPASFECPTGKYCPGGTAAPLPCPDATYQDLPGQVSCRNCPFGSYCNNNATVPIICPEGYYCPEATAYPIFCPNGTYALPGDTGFSLPTQCRQCPAKKYCHAGIIQGDCVAGYFCKSGQAVPDPQQEDTPTLGGICPRGFYCSVGTEDPISCTDNTVNPNLGAQQVSECVPCPAGYTCDAGNPVPSPCPAGQYCEFEQPPKDCLPGTYNPSTLGTNSSACLPCEPGYYCPDSAMVTFLDHPCPAGRYCPSASRQPIACAGGSFRSSQLGTSQSDCTECPLGFFCPNGSTSSTQCPQGTFCEPGTTTPSDCQGGSFCPAGSGAPQPCPAGSYCPDTTGAAIVCPQGSYCPADSDQPFLCPLGDFGPEGVSLRDSEENSCSPCPPGYAGVQNNRTGCTICEAGYVCVSGATSTTPTNNATQRGYVCPRGFYCPEGSGVEEPCPTGTFGATTGLTASDECSPCPSGTYNQLTGQAGCLPCGASATSASNATVCSCVGKNRSFQPSDGSCTCVPGFAWFDESQMVTEKDSRVDCLPIEYQSCPQGRNANGDCASRMDCATICTTGAGTFDPLTGLCDCGFSSVGQFCDASCQANQPIITISTQGISHTFNGITTTFSTSGILSGNLLTDTRGNNFIKNGDVKFLAGANGFNGLYNVTASYLSTVFASSTVTTSGADSLFADGKGGGSASLMEESRETREMFGVFSGRTVSSTGRSLLQQVTPAGVPNPVMCLGIDSTVVWDVSQGVYPVYIKDSLYNTNPSFDYGNFRTLAAQITGGVSLSNFVFSFFEAGTYVFGESSNLNRQTIIVIKPGNGTCGGAPIAPITRASLTQAGATTRTAITVQPDYVMIGLILAGVTLLVIIVIFIVHWYRTKRYSRLIATESSYRKLGYDYSIDLYGREFALKREQEKKKRAADAKRAALEQFNLQKKSALAGSVRDQLSASALDSKNSLVEGNTSQALSQSGFLHGEGSGTGIVTLANFAPSENFGQGYTSRLEDKQANAAFAQGGGIAAAKFYTEDLTSRTAFDKLQDQTILLMSQLTDHSVQSSESFARINNETKEIKKLVTRFSRRFDPLVEEDLPVGRDAEEVILDVEFERKLRLQYEEDVGASLQALLNMMDRVKDLADSSSRNRIKDIEFTVDGLRKENKVLRKLVKKEKGRRGLGGSVRMRQDRVEDMEQRMGSILSSLFLMDDEPELSSHSNLQEFFAHNFSLVEDILDHHTPLKPELTCGNIKESLLRCEPDLNDMLRRKEDAQENMEFHADECLRLLRDFIGEREERRMDITDSNLDNISRRISKQLRDMLREEAKAQADAARMAIKPIIVRVEREVALVDEIMNPEEENPVFDDDDEMDRLLNEYDESRLQMEDHLKQEREKQMRKYRDKLALRRQKLASKHQDEIQELDQDLQEEEEKERKELEVFQDELQEEKLKELREEHEARVRDVSDDPEEVRRLEERFRAENAALMKKLADERKRAKDRLEGKLRGRRRKAVEDLKEVQAQEAKEEEEEQKAAEINMDDILDRFGEDTQALKNHLKDTMQQQQERWQARLARKKAMKDRLLLQKKQQVEEEVAKDMQEEEEDIVLRAEDEIKEKTQRLQEDKVMAEERIQKQVDRGELDAEDAAEEISRVQQEFEERQRNMTDRMSRAKEDQVARLHRRMEEQKKRQQRKLDIKKAEEAQRLADDTMEVAREALDNVDEERELEEFQRRMQEMEEEMQQRIRELEEKKKGLQDVQQSLEQEMERREQEEKVRKEEVERSINQRFESKQVELQKQCDADLNGASSEEEKQRIKQKFEENMLSLNTRKQKELDKQRDSFEARKAKARQEMDRKRKLAENKRVEELLQQQLVEAEEQERKREAEKRKLKEEKLKKKAEDAQAEAIAAAAASSSQDPSAAAMEQQREATAAKKREEEERQRQEEMVSAQRIREIEEEAERRRVEMMERLEQERQEELRRLEEEFRRMTDEEFGPDDASVAAVSAERQRLEEERMRREEEEAMSMATTEEAKAKIHARFEAQKAQMQEKLQQERARQMDAVRRKKEKAKRARQLQLEKQLEERKRVELQMQADEVHTKLEEVEKDAILKSMDDVEDEIPEEKKEMLEVIIRRRQDREYEELMVRQEEELHERLALMKRELKARYEDEEEEFARKQRIVEEELQKDAAELREAKKRHMQELRELCDGNAQAMEEELEVERQNIVEEHFREKLKMKKRHMKELEQELDEITPEMMLIRREAKKAKELKENLEAMRLEAEREKAEQARLIEEHRRQAEEEARLEYERVVEESRKKEEEAQRRVEELARLLQEKQKEEEEEQHEQEETGQTVERVLEEGSKAIQEQRQALEASKERAKAKILERQKREKERRRKEVERLTAEKRRIEEEAERARREAEQADRERREREEREAREREERERKQREEEERRAREEEERLHREEAKRKELEEQRLKLIADRKKQEMEAVRKREAFLQKQREKEMAARAAAAGPSSFETVEYAGGTPEERLVTFLVRSPLFKKMLDIEKLILTLQDKNNKYSRAGPFLDRGGDVNEREVLRTRLVQTSAAFSDSEMLVINLGKSIMSLLFRGRENKLPDLLIADSLPVNYYAGNAFANTTHFEQQKNVLYVQRGRLSSIGDFLLVLCHACAHLVSPNGMHNDTDVAFLENFYSNIRVVLQHLYQGGS